MFKRKAAAPEATGRIRSQNPDFFRKNPLAAAYAAKMVKDHWGRTSTPGGGVDVPNESIFSALINRRAQKNLDAETIIKLSPDIKLIKSLITSIIMSPMDMDSGGLTYKMGETDLPGFVTNPLVDIIREHFTSYYDLDEELPDIIGEALFDQGASIRIIVPEASADDMINGSTRVSNEEYFSSLLDEDKRTYRPVGILGGVTTLAEEKEKGKKNPPNGRVSLESAFMFQIPSMSTKVNDMVSITDNIDILNLPILKERVKEQFIKDKMNAGVYQNLRRSGVSNESGPGTIKTLQSALYTSRMDHRQGHRTIDIMPSASQASRSSIGNPSILKAASESGVPCFTPGNEKKHLGYVFMLDQSSGHIVNVKEEMKDNISRGMGSLDNSQAMNLTSSLIQQTQIMSSGYCVSNDKMSAEERLKLFTQVFEENILKRIQNGILGHNVKLGENEDFINVMLARNWANQNLHMVFVPAEQVAYFAYEYDSNGMGKSLLDDVKQVSTLRIMTTFANFMSAVANAVGRTKVTLNIDPRSPDPEKDVHILMDEYMRGQSNSSPTDVTSAAEMFRTLRQMGVSFETQGNDRIPNTSVQVDSYQSNKQMIDPEFMNELKNQQYMGLFVTPDMVDMTQQGDFAITRWTSNQLFAKRIKQLQIITCRHAKKFVKAYTFSSGYLIQKLQKAIDSVQEKLPDTYKNRPANEEPLKWQLVLEEFMEKLELELPQPSSTKYQTQLEEMQKYESIVDMGLRWTISQELEDGTTDPEDQANITMLMNSAKAYHMRKYMIDNDIMPELADYTRKGTEDNPALSMAKEYTLHINNLMNNLGDWGKAVQLRRQKRKEWLEKNNPEMAEKISNGQGATASSTDDTSTDDNADFNDDDFAMPNFDEGTPPDDNNPDDNQPEQPPETEPEPTETPAEPAQPAEPTGGDNLAT